MTVEKLIEKLSLKSLSLPEKEREITGGYTGDLLSWVMGNAKSGDVWITIMSNINIVAVASLTDVACIILAENVEVDEKTVTTAESRGINILSSKLSAFELAHKVSRLIKGNE